MINKIIKIDNENIKSFLFSLMIFKKRELIFLFFTFVIPVLIINVGLTIFLDYQTLINYSYTLENLNLIAFPIYFVIALFIYKKITKCNEKHLYKISIQFILLLALTSFIVTFIFLFPYSDNKLLFILREIIERIAFILSSLIILLGLARLYYSKKFNWNKIIILYIVGLIISIVSMFYSIYEGKPLYQILDIKLLVSGTSGILLYYAYEKFEKLVIVKYKEIAVFTVLAVIFFILGLIEKIFEHLINLLFLNTNDFILIFLRNIEVFLGWFLYGIFFYWYNKKK